MIKDQEMKDVEKFYNEQRSFEGPIPKIVSGTELHMIGPSKNVAYIK